jgi:3-methylornithine--L-lysine ligase
LLIAIVGGGLQGVEVAYLSKKAGFQVMILDKTPYPPAKGLADDFVHVDICKMDKALAFLEKADLVLPALESDKALAALNLWQKNSTTPICFDFNAYKVSSSKQESNKLFSRLGIPKPMYWPQCGFPVVVKPSVGSGSHGVRIISSNDEWEKLFDTQQDPSAKGSSAKEALAKESCVVEEYIKGPSYSLEIIGSRGRYETLQVTELFMDEKYDCKQVIAPVEIKAGLIRNFEKSAITIARDMKLDGIMDFEVILHKGEMKMLEIDARFPSQTPMAVYASTGVNMVEILADLALNKQMDMFFQQKKPGTAFGNELENVQKHVIVEHVLVNSRGISIKGENIMKSCGPLHLETDFFGADEAITNFAPGLNKWVATLIVKGEARKEVIKKNNQILEGLALQYNLPLKPPVSG